jgi:DnaK suppressor protein
MTKTEINRFRRILEARQTELARVLRNREGIVIEKSPDALDEVQHATERELAIRNLDRESHLLRHVKAALRRLDDLGIAVAERPGEIPDLIRGYL